MSFEPEKVPAAITFKGLENGQAVFRIRHPDADEDEMDIVLDSSEYQEVLELSEDGSTTSILKAFSRMYSVHIRQCLNLSEEEDGDWSPNREYDGSTGTNTKEDLWGSMGWSPGSYE